ncbi:MAG: pre-peptidase C-terminal domain-containing protein [Pirellulaceae bacterium]
MRRYNSRQVGVFRFEPLEDRHLLAADISIQPVLGAGGTFIDTLLIDADSRGGRVVITQESRLACELEPNPNDAIPLIPSCGSPEGQVEMTGIRVQEWLGDPSTHPMEADRTYGSTWFTEISFVGSENVDEVQNATLLPATLVGNGGNDVLIGGASYDAIYGGSGEDTLIGGAGRDRILGGPHDDHICGGKDYDRIEGGDGNDEISDDPWGNEIAGENGDDLIWYDAPKSVPAFLAASLPASLDHPASPPLGIAELGAGSDTIVLPRLIFTHAAPSWFSSLSNVETLQWFEDMTFSGRPDANLEATSIPSLVCGGIDFVEPFLNSQELLPGFGVTSQISQIGEVDSFHYQVWPGGEFEVGVSPFSGFEAVLVHFGSDGRVQTAVGDTDNPPVVRFDGFSTWPGAVTVSASDSKLGAHYTYLEVIDDYSDSSRSGMPILRHFELNGDIEEVDDTDVFSLTLNAGEIISVRTILGGLQDSVLKAYGPDEQLIASNDDVVTSTDLSSQVTITAPTDGAYAFHVSGFGAEVGRYSIETTPDLRNEIPGDANLDGRFDSSDLVQVFGANQYEDNLPRNSHWIHGDWNHDGEFNTSDLIAAFQFGAYEQEANASRPDQATQIFTDNRNLAAAAVDFFHATNDGENQREVKRPDCEARSFRL